MDSPHVHAKEYNPFNILFLKMYGFNWNRIISLSTSLSSIQLLPFSPTLELIAIFFGFCYIDIYVCICMQIYNTHTHTNEANLNLDFSSGSSMGGTYNFLYEYLFFLFQAKKYLVVYYSKHNNPHICPEHSCLLPSPTIHHGHLWVPRSIKWLPDSFFSLQ